MSAAPTLRLPREELGGCCWLPRLIDKARLQQRGELPLIYRVLLGNALGIDGEFLRHFRLRGAETTAALRATADDAAALQWFRAQPGVSGERIQSWNARAIQLGAPGGPMRWSFGLVRRLLYPNVPAGTANTFFELVEADEKPRT